MKSSAVARGAGGQHAIHHVDAQARVLLDLVGIADAHDVTRLVFGQQRQNFRDHFEGEFARLADAEAADGVAVEVHFNEALGALAAEIAVHAALDDAEEGLGADRWSARRIAPIPPNARDLGHPRCLQSRSQIRDLGHPVVWIGQGTSWLCARK